MSRIMLCSHLEGSCESCIRMQASLTQPSTVHDESTFLTGCSPQRTSCSPPQCSPGSRCMCLLQTGISHSHCIVCHYFLQLDRPARGRGNPPDSLQNWPLFTIVKANLWIPVQHFGRYIPPALVRDNSVLSAPQMSVQAPFLFFSRLNCMRYCTIRNHYLYNSFGACKSRYS